MKTLESTVDLDLKPLNLDLVNGEYTPQEALEIINHLLMKKIQFHELKSFSNLIRAGIEDNDSLHRIVELRSCKKSFENLLKSLDYSNDRLKICSTITIEVVQPTDIQFTNK